MKNISLLLIVAAGATWLLHSADARAEGPWKRGERLSRRFAATQSWHGSYYHTEYGYPLALVVPPNAESQVSMGWGVTNTERRHIYHQFARPYPGEGGAGGMELRPTPAWPSHTDQFGVYYVRGPW